MTSTLLVLPAKPPVRVIRTRLSAGEGDGGADALGVALAVGLAEASPEPPPAPHAHRTTTLTSAAPTTRSPRTPPPLRGTRSNPEYGVPRTPTDSTRRQ
ncbi:hypothetical protein GCM10010336_04170 [Streptomyces goshikiensis]|nr:hypothetical protein GCM10010336_04170 [Streptomyces goshikiensis]